METRIGKSEALAFWLAPLASVVPLIPVFCLRSSPLFLGKLMADPTHPMNWAGWGPWLSAIAVTFDGTILAYFVAFLVAVPIYLLCRRYRKVSGIGVLIIFSLTGVSASQLVHLLQGFRQPALRDFANSWLSPAAGRLCGLVAGVFFPAAWKKVHPWRCAYTPLPAARRCLDCLWLCSSSSRTGADGSLGIGLTQTSEGSAEETPGRK